MRFGVVVACLLASVPALAETPEPVRIAQEALQQALSRTPMSLAVATFVRADADGFGMYQERGNNRFAKGEKLSIYMEPLGFKYKPDGDMITFGFTVDFSILKGDSILGGKEKFLDQTFRSHHANDEIMLNTSINLTGAPAGDYEVELVVHDKSSQDSAHVRLPFTITE